MSILSQFAAKTTMLGIIASLAIGTAVPQAYAHDRRTRHGHPGYQKRTGASWHWQANQRHHKNRHHKNKHYGNRYVSHSYDTHQYGSGATGFGKTFGGGLIGAILGAAAGTQFGKGKGRTAAVIGSSVIGMVLGSEIGRSMEPADQQRTATVLESNRTGDGVTWQNPDSGAEYTVTPTRTWEAEPGRYCREYNTTVIIGGQEQAAYGTACRMPDGSWKASIGD
ncbi:MAG: glycine zipper 2TM domain-containing protein [Rhodospirillaceae bacterium]|nr:glycine zipper 2TM domain-containing protein [Rhodospirillaceae bacterium]MBT6137590.1 glycine zipper 2TM domain-containing protein [Rhodospirillaceae bacterium]